MSAGGHAGRDHAKLSASGAHRWLVCTPSAALEAQFPDTGSAAAAEGTLAHEIAEIKARCKLFKRGEAGYMTKAAANKKLAKLAAEELHTEEMETCTDEYAEEIYLQYLGFSEKPYVYFETRLDLTSYVPEGFGTADAILIGGGKLVICDFKYGKGVPVSPDHNPQLMLYALGALDKYGLIFPIAKVVLAIHQPRLQTGLATWETTPEELLAFGEYVKTRAALAIDGAGEYAPGSEQCRFCRARQVCRARADHNIEMAFSAALGALPPIITAQEAGEYISRGEDVAKWLQDLKDWALGACLRGEEVPGYKAVEGRGSREWTDQAAAFKALQDGGIDEAMMYERKALTLAALEKVVGKKRFGELAGEYVEKKPGKPALVPESDKRPPITSADKAFEGVEV